MSKQKFVDYNFRAGTLESIEAANEIVREYRAQGYRLTLRQLYYQHVARGLIDNTERNYKKMGDTISKARLAGLIDWDAIEDRTRSLRGLSHWNSPAEIIKSAHYSFRIDKWASQPNRVEVWIEKDALVGVIEAVCQEADVDFFACRGYVSQSEMFTAGQRIARYIRDGHQVHILHLGDHDPSGMDMTRDIRDRLEMFVARMGADINRLALNWDQIEQYNPPPNPAKATDSRFDGYAEEYGLESWELDALEPAVISQLISDNIQRLRDPALWAMAVAEEETHRSLLNRAASEWDGVVDYLSN